MVGDRVVYIIYYKYYVKLNNYDVCCIATATDTYDMKCRKTCNTDSRHFVLHSATLHSQYNFNRINL